MSPPVFGLIVFGCVLGGGLLGVFLRLVLPERHLGAESRDLVRLTMGLLATMSALVVGLLITTAKTSYDTQGSEFKRMCAEIVLLDRALAHYGPEASPARRQLRRAVAEILGHMEAQRTLRAEALRLGVDIGLMR